MNEDRDSRSGSSRQTGSERAPAWRKKEFQKPVENESDRHKEKEAVVRRKDDRDNRRKEKRRPSSSSSSSESSGKVWTFYLYPFMSTKNSK